MLALAADKDDWPPQVKRLGDGWLKMLDTDRELHEWLETDKGTTVVAYFEGECGALGLFVQRAPGRILTLQRLIDNEKPSSKSLAAWEDALEDIQRRLALVNAVKAAHARGSVILTQKRYKDGHYGYLATRALKREEW